MTLDDSEDEQIAESDALLLFLANGTLTGIEHETIEAAVAESPRLQAQLHLLKAVRADLRSSQTPEGLGHKGLERLLSDLEVVTPDQNPRPHNAIVYLKWAALILMIVLLWRPTSCSLAGMPSRPETAMATNAIAALDQKMR